MLDKTEARRYLPEEGRVLFTCKNGKIASARIVYDDEYVASLKVLIDLASKAGYRVVLEDDSKL
ncbi:hypothetical protein [Pseudescherichia sp.]|uniref:hypothetical protein n=1 Tax=Pseudescherichia sp. TaxID=2055881 RepID=UPI002899F145|nr:hypothetical protein [Pseudescherichia sp.]